MNARHRPGSRALTGFLVAVNVVLFGVVVSRWQAQARPPGHAELSLEAVGPHPIEPGRFLYEVRLLGVTRNVKGTEVERASRFRVRTRRGEEWSNVAAVSSGSVTPEAAHAGRRPLTFTISLDRWGNEVDPFQSSSPDLPAWRVPEGVECIAITGALITGDTPPEELEISGTWSAPNGIPLPFRVTARVPERKVSAPGR
jgi:hypothetical protein